MGVGHSLIQQLRLIHSLMQQLNIHPDRISQELTAWPCNGALCTWAEDALSG